MEDMLQHLMHKMGRKYGNKKVGEPVDLSRAKTILIIIFLALNIILAYQIYQKQNKDNDYTTLIIEETKEVVQLLNSNLIYLDVDIPIITPDLPFLNVIANYPNLREIKENLLISDDELLISLVDGNTIKYKWIQEGKDYAKAYNINNGRQEFARQYLYKGKYYVVLNVEIEDGNGRINYIQQHNGYKIYGTRAIANVENNKITNWLQNIVLDIEAEETVRPILAAATAIRSLTNNIDNKPATITDISLGYYSRQQESESWLLPPVWAIDLADGERFYINAFTGELEGLQD